MSRWGDTHRENRRARADARRARVLAAIMAANGYAGQPPRCLFPTCTETENLSVDHPHGRTWNVRKPNFETRQCIYERELKDGVPLGLLCQHHSGRDGRLRFQARPKWRLLDALTAPVPNALSARERLDLAEYLYGPLWIWEAA